MFFAEPTAGVSEVALVGRLKERGVLIFVPTGSRTLRLVTHYGIDASDIDRALDAFATVTETVAS